MPHPQLVDFVQFFINVHNSSVRIPDGLKGDAAIVNRSAMFAYSPNGMAIAVVNVRLPVIQFRAGLAPGVTHVPEPTTLSLKGGSRQSWPCRNAKSAASGSLT
jgi:hypothetical protein